MPYIIKNGKIKTFLFEVCILNFLFIILVNIILKIFKIVKNYRNGIDAVTFDYIERDSINVLKNCPFDFEKIIEKARIGNYKTNSNQYGIIVFSDDVILKIKFLFLLPYPLAAKRRTYFRNANLVQHNLVHNLVQASPPYNPHKFRF